MSKMNLLNQLLNKARKSTLGAEVHDNVYLDAIDINERPNNDRRNLFIKFGKVDIKTGKVLGVSEISWFKLDFTHESVEDTGIEQLGQLMAILESFLTPEEVDEKFNPFDSIGVTDEDGYKAKVKTAEGCIEIMNAWNEKFFEVLEPFVGPYTKDTPLVRFKLVYDRNGKYIQTPRYGDFCEAMSVPVAESRIQYSNSEKANKTLAEDPEASIAGAKSKKTLVGDL